MPHEQSWAHPGYDCTMCDVCCCIHCLKLSHPGYTFSVSGSVGNTLKYEEWGTLRGKWIDLTLHHNISIYSNTSSRRYNLLWLRHNSNKHLSLGAWPQGQRLFLMSRLKQVDWGDVAFNLDNWGMGTSPFILWEPPLEGPHLSRSKKVPKTLIGQFILGLPN